MRGSGRLVAVAMALLGAEACWAAPASGAAPAPLPEISGLASPRQGATWISLRWDSNVTLHDVMWREWRGVKRTERWGMLAGVPPAAYTVGDLKPNTPYQFRVRARGKDPGAKPALSAAVLVRTRAEAPLTWWGLTLWPERHFPSPGKDVTFSAIEAYGGKLYVLQTIGARLWLSRVAVAGSATPRRSPQGAFTLGRDRMQVEWTRDITPVTSEAEAPCLSPQLRVFGDRLWVTWHAQVKEPTDPDFSTLRQRLMYYDLAEAAKDTADQPYAQRVSAPLEILPSVAGRDTCFGSLSVFQDTLWVQWTEAWREAGDGSRAVITLGAYDAGHGRIAEPIAWLDCPSLGPLTPSAAQFADALVVLYGDGGEDPSSAQAQALVCARFDGRSFQGVRVLRGLGKNREPRAAQVQDQLYVVHQTDLAYPGSGGIWQDLCLTRLDSRGLVSEALEFVADMKYNSAPSVAAMGDDLYIAYTKQDRWPGESAALRGQSFGTYLWRVSVVAEGAGGG